MQMSLRHLSFAALLLAASCGGGGGGGTGTLPPTAGGSSASILVTDAGVDDLSAFSATLTSFELIGAGGNRTGNLLAAPRTVELLELQGRSELLQVAGIPPGTYTGAAVTFSEVRGRDLLGAPYPVRLGTPAREVTFSSPVVVGGNERVNVRLHVDLEASLDDDPGGTGLLFEPELEVERRSQSSEPLDEIHGRLLDKDPAGRRLTVRLTDRDTGVALGTLPVQVGNQTAFFDDNGNPVSESTFFVIARIDSRIESNGALDSGGIFQARTIKAEDDDDGVAKIEGTITDLDLAGSSLMLRIHEVEKGRAVAEPVLAALGNPGVIAVDFGGAVIVVEGPSSRRGAPSDLAVGQEVKVKFRAFATSPFPARKIEIEDERPEFEGRITDVSGLPNSIVMHLEHHDPSVLSGRVQSSRTDVRVDLDGSERIWLKLVHEPEIASSQLLPGLKLRVRGTISGPASSPAIDASDLRVRPGRLEGLVTGGNGLAGTFTVQVDRVDKPFGGPPLPNPLVCTFATNARVERDAGSVTAFFNLMTNTPSRLEVRLFGISDGQGGVLAHEVEARRR